MHRDAAVANLAAPAHPETIAAAPPRRAAGGRRDLRRAPADRRDLRRATGDGRDPLVCLAVAVLLPVVVVLVAAGCARGLEREPPDRLVPTSAGDDGRRACHALSALGEGNEDAGANRFVGDTAAKASDPGIAEAGRRLSAAAAGASGGSSGGSGGMGVGEAQVGLGDACTRAFGDGPW